MNSESFHFKDGTKKQGPFTFEQMQQIAAEGLIGPDTMIWRPGMDTWQNASSIEGIFPPSLTVPPSPPPLPARVDPAVQVKRPIRRAPPPLRKTAPPRQSSRGFRLHLWPALIGLALVIGGTRDFFTGIGNTKVQEITISALEAQTPEAMWLRINDGELDIPNSWYSTWVGRKNQSESIVTEIYIPLRRKGFSEDDPIQVIVKSNDDELIQVVQKINSLSSLDQPVPDELPELMAHISNLLDDSRREKSIQGLVESRVGSDIKSKLESKGLAVMLAPDCIVIDEGVEPSASKGIAMIILGLLIGGVFHLPSIVRILSRH